MRLFVAIDLDEASRQAIAAVQQRLRSSIDGPSSPRWVHVEHLHMTLVFLGEVEGANAGAVVTAFSGPLARPPFTLSFRGLGVFPPRGAPRALWIGVGDGERELRDLQQDLAARAARVGVPVEPRGFSPHLTLARWKHSRPSDRGRVLALAPEATVARVAITQATLYQSRLSSQGPTYTPLAHVTLTAPT